MTPNSGNKTAEDKKNHKEQVNYVQSEGNFTATMVNFPQIIVQAKSYEEMVRGIRILFQTVISKAQQVIWNEDYKFVEQPASQFKGEQPEGGGSTTTWSEKDWMAFIMWYSGMNEKSIRQGIKQYEFSDNQNKQP